MVRGRAVVGGPVGLHARPAAEVVRTAEKFKSRIRIGKGSMWVNGKSILALLSLAAEKGSELLLEVDGADEAQALEAVRTKLENCDSQA